MLVNKRTQEKFAGGEGGRKGTQLLVIRFRDQTIAIVRRGFATRGNPHHTPCFMALPFKLLP